ncbi:MAG: cytochrome b/b6 domain-containing protein [Xanthomonadales bacterium]|nr:cytochrome b/b6 domain-containing protein [Xanthomonadales bacterium]
MRTTATSNTKESPYLHTLPVRVWHWINAICFVLLILTGLQIRYLDVFNVMSFEAAVNLHNWTGFVVIAAWFLWLFSYLFSDRITNYHPDLNARSFFERFIHQIEYYSYGMFKGEEKPHQVQPYDKFNPMQKLTYQVVMFIACPIIFVTGLMMWDVSMFAGSIELLGGIRVVNTIHVLLFIVFTGFIIVHAYMGSLGQKPSSHFKEMFTGYEEEHAESPKP